MPSACSGSHACSKPSRLASNSITGGGTGIYLKPINDLRPLYYVVAGWPSIMLLLTWKLDNSRLGLKLLAIREDENAAESLGIPTTRLKIGTFVASAIAPAAMGSLYAVYLGFIDPPTAFAPNIELTTIAMVLLGGMGTVLGPLVGALVLSVVNEVLWANYPQIYLACVGVIILLAVLFMPRGIVSLGMKSGWLRARTTAVSPIGRECRAGAVMSDADPCGRKRLQALCRPHRARCPSASMSRPAQSPA